MKSNAIEETLMAAIQSGKWPTIISRLQEEVYKMKGNPTTRPERYFASAEGKAVLALTKQIETKIDTPSTYHFSWGEFTCTPLQKVIYLMQDDTGKLIHDHFIEISICLKLGADVNQVNEEGKSILHTHTQRKHIQPFLDLIQTFQKKCGEFA